MKKNTILYILLIFLLGVNGYFIYNQINTTSKERDPRKTPMQFIAEELAFDQKQLSEFEKLSASHQEEMRIVSDKIRKEKDQFFRMLSDSDISEREVDSVATKMSIIEKEKELIIFRHFKEIQQLCNEDQKQKFSKILRRAIHQRGGPRGEEGRPHHPPPPRH
ncbi:MAG: Spy/CpxP family protein refolding chaperone [bacterium]